MKEQFIPYEIAVQLKQLGFNQKCFDLYDDVKSIGILGGKRDRTPKILWQQAFDYFREDHNLCSWIYQSNKTHFYFSILKENRFVTNSGYFESFNKAKLSCLENLILKVQSKDA